MTGNRVPPPFVGDERAMLNNWLEWLSVDTVRLPAITTDDLTTWAAGRFAAAGAGPQWTLPPPVAAVIAAKAGTNLRCTHLCGPRNFG